MVDIIIFNKERVISVENKYFGLKYFWKSRKSSGQKFRYKLADYFREIKYYFRSAWYGYTFWDIAFFDSHICKRIIFLLEEYQNTAFKYAEKPKHLKTVIPEIIDCLEYEIDDLKALDVLYPNKFHLSSEEYDKARKLQEEKVKHGFELLGENIGWLWF